MIKFHIGCGKRNWTGWVNIDGASYPHINDNDTDLKYQPNEYIDLLYSSHMIAYFDVHEFTVMLRIWFTKIKPGGAKKATPDLKKISYMLNNGLCTLPEVIGPLYGEMLMGNVLVHHKAGYDFNTLEDILLVAGFVDVKPYDHRKTEHPNTGDRSDFFDDHSAAYLHGELISLNVECKKPL